MKPLVCVQCGHKWYPQTSELPQRCPNCSSPYWNDPNKDPPKKVPRKFSYTKRKPRRTKATMELVRIKEDVLLMQAQLGDDAARNELLRIHTPFVTGIAKQYCRPYIELEDLVSIGLVALNARIAMYEFDHHHKYPGGLLAYAYKWIKWCMSDAEVKAKQLVFPEEAHWYFDEKEWVVPPTQEDGVMCGEVIEIAERVLDGRDLGIVRNYYIGEMTLHELGALYGISYERVRQLRDRAIHKIRVHLKLVGKSSSPTPVPRLGVWRVHEHKE